jgi:hypothetical protein
VYFFFGLPILLFSFQIFYFTSVLSSFFCGHFFLLSVRAEREREREQAERWLWWEIMARL